MLYASANCMGVDPANTVYTFFSFDWKRSFDVELSVAQFKKLRTKKKRVQIVSWMEVLTNSNERHKTGAYATDVTSIKELEC